MNLYNNLLTIGQAVDLVLLSSETPQQYINS